MPQAQYIVGVITIRFRPSKPEMKTPPQSSRGIVGPDLNWAIHSIKPRAAHSPLLITSPNPPWTIVWWNKVMKTKLSWIKTRILVKILLNNESLLSPDPNGEQFQKSSTQVQLISHNLCLFPSTNTVYKSTQSFYVLNLSPPRLYKKSPSVLY
ncbi:hypothetical protein AVEN_150797-1 [Araneus ventricosus]|uniref:Uncharacterized protein n=1 Tax=Araneus ventricosus TaxID=182803 RepID=A0A4Y2R0P7_ARAVE|nr:hypothetical protein AVEN_150797-1 [Araneus ventricosus]